MDPSEEQPPPYTEAPKTESAQLRAATDDPDICKDCGRLWTAHQFLDKVSMRTVHPALCDQCISFHVLQLLMRSLMAAGRPRRACLPFHHRGSCSAKPSRSPKPHPAAQKSRLYMAEAWSVNKYERLNEVQRSFKCRVKEGMNISRQNLDSLPPLTINAVEGIDQVKPELDRKNQPQGVTMRPNHAEKISSDNDGAAAFVSAKNGITQAMIDIVQHLRCLRKEIARQASNFKFAKSEAASIEVVHTLQISIQTREKEEEKEHEAFCVKLDELVVAFDDLRQGFIALFLFLDEWDHLIKAPVTAERRIVCQVM